MAKGYTFDKEAFEAWKASQKESLEIQNKMNSSVSGYLETVKKISELQKNIKFIDEKVAQLKKEQAKAAQDLKDNEDKLAKAKAKNDKAEIKALEDKKEELEKILAAKKEGVAITEKELGLLKETNKQLVESAKNASAMSAVLGSSVGFLGKVPGLIGKGFGKLKGTGIFDMEKPILNANKSMAGSEKTYENIFNSIKNSAKSTTMWGVGVKDLALMQQGYSESIGRSVILTQKGNEAMAGLSEGTGLGKEFAVQMAGEMDKFNISAERTGTIVEGTMNKAAKIGVNGAAALKVFQNNLKLAQRFNFKNGIKGLADFSVQATRLRLDMQGIAGLADKVFNPEGAIELAATLTTLGGRFASLGDPMQLMFKGRNDMASFAKDIGKASAELLTFNKENGEFEKKTGLAAHKMKVLAKELGIAEEELFNMAEAQARIEEVSKNLKGGMFEQEDTELITSLAKFDKKKGWVINLNGQDKLVKDLRATDMKNIRAEEKTLQERAEFGRSFDETIQDLILMAKEMLLPLAKSLRENFGERVKELAKWFNSSEFRTMVEDVITGIGTFIKYVGDFMKNNPITSAVIAGGTLFGGIIGKAAMWIANGVSLGIGFMSVTKGMGGGMGMGGGIPGAAGKFMSGAGVAGLVSAGFAGYNEYSENAAMGMGGGENAGRTTSKAAGAGLGAWGGAAAGAAIGSAVPIIGTLIGGLIGGAIGSFAGSELGEGIGDAIYGPEKNTKSNAIASGANTSDLRRVNDGIIFHPQDKFMQVGSNAMIASTQKGQLDKAANKLTGGGSSGNISHKFEDLKIKVEISAPTDEKAWREIFNSPEIMRRLTQEIHIATESAVAGGKITGSGPKRRGKK
jgi:hypothetical protein